MTGDTRLKHVARVGAGQSPPSQEVTEYIGEGLPFLQGNAEFGPERPTPVNRCDTATRVAEAGGLLVSVRAPVGAVNIADRRYGIGRGLAVVEPRTIDARYAYWLLHHASEELNSVATGSTFTAVTGSDVGDVRVPIVGGVQQRAIADYLDRETAQIDAFIAKNEELIALLTERRATVIDRSVFGLRHASEPMERRVPDFVEEHAALRDFVRQTPIGWSVARFKSVTRRRDARNVDASATMRSLKITGEIVRRTSQQNPDDSSIPRYLLVEPNDLVVNPMWLVGGAIGVSTRHGAVSPDYRVFRPRSALSPRFLHHLLRSRPYRAQYELFTRAETTFDRRVNQRDLDRLPIPLPPIDEQVNIAATIDRELDRIDDTIEVAKRSVELARERRAALISAAVTGKIDVGVAA